MRIANLLLLFCSTLPAAVFPGKTWEKRRPAQWDAEKLKAAKEFSSRLKTAAVVIVQDGVIVDEWGDVTKKYLSHSMRKSLLSALYGIAVQEGKIDISKTMKDLSIDDNAPSLTENEKQAKVSDLLKSRSGIYHPSAAGTPSMNAIRPPRFSHAPGSFWYYNNWDFNALGTIYEKYTGEKIHASFERRIAQPIGMEHFTAADGDYTRSSDSIHAAYPFRISARDLARFGHLFLNKGKWNGRQIVPEKWVAESTQAWSDASTYNGTGYGYMWWVDRNSYSARGAGGHYVMVVPAMNLVVVHRVDTFVSGNEVGQNDFFKLLSMIIDAGGRKELNPVAESKIAAACHKPDATCAEWLYQENKALLYYRSHSLHSGTHPGIKRAMIMVHGASRNGDAYYGVAMASTAAAGLLAETALVAPQFKANTGACRDKLEPAEYGFSCEGWKVGEAAANSASGKPAYSFDFVDGMVRLLNNRGRFPNLTEIIVAGHSAGGQFVQRYAATTRAESRLPVRYVVANPSSYMYLNNIRISRQGSCDIDGNCKGRFARYWDAENCTTFNQYKHGLDALSGYAAVTSPDVIRQQYIARNVTYLAGALDVNQDSDLEGTCNAYAQGFNRRERATIFWNYMRTQFQAKHKIAIIGGCGHSATCMFASPATLPVLFPNAVK
ncbi:MAG: serine hydrolase [Candidatus Solibacter usitatus]|nr:serine hydrolase [Candidatus Solibacter usitatus]